MNYITGEKIQLLDMVRTDTGVEGAVVGFDKVNSIEFIALRADSAEVFLR